MIYIVTCQTRTALVKFSLRNLIVYFLLCQLAHFWTVSHRYPEDWQFTGDPGPLARGNIMDSDRYNRRFPISWYIKPNCGFQRPTIVELHSHKILSIQHGKPCYLSILSNPWSDQEESQACSESQNPVDASLVVSSEFYESVG